MLAKCKVVKQPTQTAINLHKTQDGRRFKMNLNLPKDSYIEETKDPKPRAEQSNEVWRQRMIRAKLELAMQKLVAKSTRKVAQSTTRLLHNDVISSAYQHFNAQMRDSMHSFRHS